MACVSVRGLHWPAWPALVCVASVGLSACVHWWVGVFSPVRVGVRVCALVCAYVRALECVCVRWCVCVLALVCGLTWVGARWSERVGVCESLFACVSVCVGVFTSVCVI